MKKDALRVTSTIPVAPTTLYLAWLNTEQHSAMTGTTAKIDSAVGGNFSAQNGYISGKHVALDLGRRIVMSWRTSDFPRDAHDSKVEVHFEALGGSTRVLILHTEIPEGQGEKYRSTWNDSYFGPMRTYFSKYLPDPRKPPPPRRLPPPPDDEDEEKPVKKAKYPPPKPAIIARPTPPAAKKAAAAPPPAAKKPAPPAKKPAPKPPKKAAKASPPPKAAAKPAAKTAKKPAPKPAAKGKKPAAKGKKPAPAKAAKRPLGKK